MKNCKRREIVVVGPWPPPTGGISAHLFRFARLLEHAGVPFRIYSTTSSFARERNVVPLKDLLKFSEMRWILCSRPAVIIHNSDVRGMILCAVLKVVGLRSAQYIHNGRKLPRAGEPTVRRLLWSILAPLIDQLFVVSEEIEKGIAALAPRANTALLPAFIPPDRDEVESVNVPSIFMQDRVIKTIGWSGLSQGAQAEFYDFPFILEVLKQLLSDGHKVRLFVADPWPVDVRELVNGKFSELGPHIVYVPPEIPFSSVMSALDLYVRTTKSDGDSIAVREALFMGVSVVASDVCSRPTGCSLYSAGDVRSCVNEVESAIAGAPRRVGQDSGTRAELAVGEFDLVDRLIRDAQQVRPDGRHVTPAE